MARKILFLNCSAANGGFNFSLPGSNGSAQIPRLQSAPGWLLCLGCHLLGENANSRATIVSVSACHEQHRGTIAGVIIPKGESAKSINTLILNKQQV